MENDLVIIIPTLNEQDGISKTLFNMPEQLIGKTIIVDSSTDKTPEIAKSFGTKVIYEPRRGYGRALQTGLENSVSEIVVYIDADYTYDPREIMTVVNPILNGKYDVVLGTRLRGKMLSGAMSSFKIFGNLMLSSIFSVFFLKYISDTQCGLRAIRRKMLVNLSYRDYGMPYVTEQLIKLVKRGAKVGEVPITYRPRIGDTKLSAWTDAPKILIVILRERFGRTKT